MCAPTARQSRSRSARTRRREDQPVDPCQPAGPLAASEHVMMTSHPIRSTIIFSATLFILATAVFPLHGQAPKAKSKGQNGSVLGYDDTPYLPGQKWRVHDSKRPHP